MTQIYGTFHETENPSQEYLNLVFSPSSLPIEQRWRNNDLSADFLANYFSTFFPVKADLPTSAHRHAEIKSAINYIANELLENAMKYCDSHSQSAISLQLQLHEDYVLFVGSNDLNRIQAERFKASIEELLASDPSELFIQRIEASAEQEDVSGLGFLTMLNDYGAELGWKFEFPDTPGSSGKVTTTIRISI